jgi:glycosyltransferase involved in cell wall biosynthesis
MLKLSMVNMCVLIPRYDSGGHLAECLDSVLMADFDDLDKLVSDDGTTDNTLKVINTCSAFSCP